MNTRLAFDGSIIDMDATRRRMTVSDHALVRYLDHVGAVDVEAWRRFMLSYGGVVQGAALGARGVIVPPIGATFVLDGFKIVTVTREGARR